MTLHPGFLSQPLAHRGLHDLDKGRPENSRAAILAAIDGGYGIEIDVQLSSDGHAMVFHDYALDRLTDETGAVRTRTAEALSGVRLKHCAETIPTLDEVLALVAGRAPLLIELKDQDGAMGASVGELEADVARALSGYSGPVAVMSFNPHAVSEMQRLAPDVSRGYVTDPFIAEDWPLLPARVRDDLAHVPGFAETGACFVSHNVGDLGSEVVAGLKASGTRILCWTVRSADQERVAREVADNITFEGYPAVIPA